MEKQDHYDGPEVTVDMLMCPLNQGYEGKDKRDIRALPINLLWWASDHPTVRENKTIQTIWGFLTDVTYENPIIQTHPYFQYLWKYAQDCDGSITCSWCKNIGVKCDDCTRRC
jgi:hypothetical protein